MVNTKDYSITKVQNNNRRTTGKARKTNKPRQSMVEDWKWSKIAGCVYFGRFQWSITQCQHGDATDKFTALPYVVMATTHVGFTSLSLATWTRSWDRHNEMKKNEEKSIMNSSQMQLCWKNIVVGGKSRYEKLRPLVTGWARSSPLIYFCLCCRFRTTAKSKSTQRTLEPHQQEKKNQVKSGLQVKLFLKHFFPSLISASFSPPQSPSPSIPPFLLLISSCFSLWREQTEWGQPYYFSLFQKPWV